MDDYDIIEQEEDGEFMWWHELKAILEQADTIHVNQEHFEKVGDIVGAELDDDGFLKWTDNDDYIEPHIPIEVDGTVEFAPLEPHAHQNPEPSSISRETLEERMELDESTPSKLHVSDLYGIEKYAGEPVFLYNDFYLGLMMDASEWEPAITVKTLHEWECELCGGEYTNRDYEVPEDASMYWVHSCPHCGKAADRSVEMVQSMEEMKIQDAAANATALRNALNE